MEHIRPGVGKLFSVKGQRVDTLGFVGRITSVITAQLCLYSVRTATDNT